MSLLDKVIAAVTPPETVQARVDARNKARSAAGAGHWLSLVLDHHVALEGEFEAVRSASTAAARRAAQKRLAVMLTGHSIAEEAVLYPASHSTAKSSISPRDTPSRAPSRCRSRRSTTWIR